VIDPADMKAVIYLGDALFKGGNLHGALKYYVAARRLDGGSALPLLRIGDVQAHIGDRRAALLTWRDAEATVSGAEGEDLYRELAKKRPTDARFKLE
jgi:hypothetical protein